MVTWGMAFVFIWQENHLFSDFLATITDNKCENRVENTQQLVDGRAGKL